MTALSHILGTQKPALLIGNGINRYKYSSSSWDDLLLLLAGKRGLNLTKDEKSEMSNTEFFDILELAAPPATTDARGELQKAFCASMKHWTPADHHRQIVEWARRHGRPIITVNFDLNLSVAIGADLHRLKGKFTDYYPWTSYYADKQITDPAAHFGIWHAHGMMNYHRSIRLGLTHYMGAVERARPWIVGKNGIVNLARKGATNWPGQNTWLQPLFFSPLLIIGFGLSRDENFFRWLFLERARLHKLVPALKTKSWYVTTNTSKVGDRRPFFERLGMELVTVPTYSDIYEADFWTN